MGLDDPGQGVMAREEPVSPDPVLHGHPPMEGQHAPVMRKREVTGQDRRCA